MFTTIDTIAGSLRARFLMVGDLIGYRTETDDLMVFEGPSGVVRVKYTPTVEFHGFVECISFLAVNEFGAVAMLTIPAEDFVPHFGREA